MKVWIASDHAAINQKQVVIEKLKSMEIEAIDLGPQDTASVHYPDFAHKVCKEVVGDDNSLGILLCGTGIGMSIVANKFHGVRAALCRVPLEAELARQHNDANVLCLGARTTGDLLISEIVEKFVDADREKGRHEERRKLFEHLGSKVETYSKPQ